MLKRKIKQKIFSATIAAVIAAMPVMNVYAADENIIIHTLSVDMSEGGSITFNEGLDNERTVRASLYDNTKQFEVYDSDGLLIELKDNIYTYSISDNDLVSIKTSADEGYQISDWNLNDIEDNYSGFSPPMYEFFYIDSLEKDSGLQVLFTKDESISETNDELSNTEARAQDGYEEDLTVTNVYEGDETDSDYNYDSSDGDEDLSVLSLTDDSNIAVHAANDTNLCHILAYEINSIIDGTAPFDTDDAAGNDSSAENGIVRSFDTINYTLKYTTAIKDSSISGIDSANVMIDFLLPCSPLKAEFNVDTMTWLLDKKLVYTYDDGSTSTVYDASKNVVSQRLTGRRLLVNNESGNTVPGTGTLAIGVNVNAAISGDKIEPTFTIWMDGNTEAEKKTLHASTVVSAAPKFDIVVKRNSSANLLGYYNLQENAAKVDKENDNDLYGRLQSYIIALAIQNDSASKGMKGVEYPDGSDITFDLKMSENMNGTDVSYEKDYQPLLWDYEMDNGGKNKGVLGRPMSPFGQSIASYGNWTTGTPFNNGNNVYSCYNGGRLSIAQDAADANLLHVTLSGYQLDMKDFDFPRRNPSASSNTISVNTGYFSIGMVQMIARFKTNVEVIENVGVDIKASNLHAISMSGKETTTEVNNSNNLSSVKVTNYPSGWHSKRSFFNNIYGGMLRNTVWGSGDAYAYIGETIRVNGHMVYGGDGYLKATNILQKIDDEAFTIPKGTSKYSYYSLSNGNSKLGDVTTLFAAKPDKTGWTNDTEMNNTREEQLIYFKNIDDLTNAGYVCVGMLYEVRNSKLYPNNAGGCISFDQILNINKVGTIGNVYMTKNDVRSWRDGTDFSYTNTIYDSSIKAYGIGDMSWKNGTYASGYTTPTYREDLSYGKAVYKEGTMVSGHTNGYVGGNSVLIIGNQAKVNIEVADRTGDKAKSVYDLDAGERTARFSVQPSTVIQSTNSEIQDSDARDNLRVEVTLPQGLHFNENGVSLKPETVTHNSNGTTTVVWRINDVKIGAKVDPITFSTTIGDEGTKNDVHHNDAFTVAAKITSDNDQRKIDASNGNYAETGISVIKLAASAVTKRVLTPLVEKGQDIEFRLRYSNLSDTEAVNAKIYDILPHNQDGRGTSYSGSYNLQEMTIDFSNAKKTYENGKTAVRNYVSSKNRDKTEMENILLTGTLPNTFLEVTNPVLNDSEYKVQYKDINIPDAASVYTYLGYVFGHEYIDIYITITPRDTDTKQHPGDIYGNNFVQYADNQASSVTSNVVKAQVVKRDLSGVAWIDSNTNGIRESSEKRIKDIQVVLYRTDKSQYDMSGKSYVIGGSTIVYNAYDIYGNVITEISTDANGAYKFDNLEYGSYIVLFKHNNEYYATATDAGTDDTIDSDAVTKSGDIFISGIQMPEISNMPEWTFSSPNHDVGLIQKTKIEFAKISAVTQELIGDAELAVYNADDIENGKPKKDKNPLYTWTTQKGKTTTLEDILIVGHKYVLVETKAPYGYAIAEPIVFTISGPTQYIVMADEYDTHPVTISKKNLDDKLIGGAKLTITGREEGNTKDIEPITWISEDANVHVVDLRKGSYVLHEEEPPVGYLTADDVHFTVDKDGNVYISGEKVDEVEMVDVEVKPCTISLKKKDSNGNNLAGVKFSLEFVSAKYPEITNQTGYNRLMKPGQTKEITTDVNGEAVFTNLDQGQYILTEIKTSSGNTLLPESITINLPLEMTEKEVAASEDIDLSKAEKIGDIYNFYELKYEISNSANLDVPTTGGSMTIWYLLIGLAAMSSTAAVILISKKQR